MKKFSQFIKEQFDMIDTLEKQFKRNIISSKKEGVKSIYWTIKTADRSGLKSDIEKYLKDKKIKFEEIMSSRSGFPCTKFDNYIIVYKPNIAKGAGGKAFEAEFSKDIENLLNCKKVDDSEFLHPDVMQKLLDILPKKLLNSNTAQIKEEGSKNQKRELVFNGSKFSLTNSTGRTLTDVTVMDKGIPYYFSLKMSKTYYLINASIFQFFKDPASQKAAYQFFGLDGKKMGEYDNMMGAKNPVYYAQTADVNQSKVKANLESIIQEALGSGYYFVHKKQKDSVTCFYNSGDIKVKVNSIESTVYPEAGKRKYTAIKTLISLDGNPYVCTFQFRGTKETDVEPKYLRMLMEKK